MLAVHVPSVGETLEFVGNVVLDIAIVVGVGLALVLGGRWLMNSVGMKVVKVSRDTVVATRSTLIPGILAGVAAYLWPQAQDAFGSVPKPMQIAISLAVAGLTATGGLLMTRGREEKKVLSTIGGGLLLAIPIAGLIVGFAVGDWWSKFLDLDTASQFYIVAGVVVYAVGIAMAALMSWEKGREAHAEKVTTTTTELRLTGPTSRPSPS